MGRWGDGEKGNSFGCTETAMFYDRLLPQVIFLFLLVCILEIQHINTGGSKTYFSNLSFHNKSSNNANQL